MAISHAPPPLRFVFVLERNIFQKYIYYVDFLFSIFLDFSRKLKRVKIFVDIIKISDFL
jgi:hypothetical protein